MKQQKSHKPSHVQFVTPNDLTFRRYQKIYSVTFNNKLRKYNIS